MVLYRSPKVLIEEIVVLVMTRLYLGKFLIVHLLGLVPLE